MRPRCLLVIVFLAVPVVVMVAISSSPLSEAESASVPVVSAQLFEYLQEHKYEAFDARDPAPHPTRGPHSKFGWPVRTFFNPPLDDSLRAGNSQHPFGSAAIKEIYDPAGSLRGWAVMVKTGDDSARGQGWFWYEIASTTDGSSPIAAGNGVPSCFSCHFSGNDFIVSDYPLLNGSVESSEDSPP